MILPLLETPLPHPQRSEAPESSDNDCSPVKNTRFALIGSLVVMSGLWMFSSLILYFNLPRIASSWFTGMSTKTVALLNGEIAFAELLDFEFSERPGVALILGLVLSAWVLTPFQIVRYLVDLKKIRAKTGSSSH